MVSEGFVDTRTHTHTRTRTSTEVGEDPWEDGVLHDVIARPAGELIEEQEVIEIGDGAALPLLQRPVCFKALDGIQALFLASEQTAQDLSKSSSRFIKL
jgi:hypothetical protein